MKLLLITGGFHPYHLTTPVITKCLRTAGHTVRVTRSARELAEPSLSGYDGIVLNTWRRNQFVEEVESLRLSYPGGDPNNDLSDSQRTGLKSFVENGGGLISLHISADSCPDWSEMKKLTGGGWVSGVSTHGHFGQFTVNIWDRDHPVTNGMDDFETHDELYCDMDLQPGIDIFIGSALRRRRQAVRLVERIRRGKGRQPGVGPLGRIRRYAARRARRHLPLSAPAAGAVPATIA